LPIANCSIYTSRRSPLPSSRIFREEFAVSTISNANIAPNMKNNANSRRPTSVSADALSMSNGAFIHTHDEIRQSSSPAKVSQGMPSLRLNRVMAFVDANITVDLCVSTLAAVAGMSPYYFCRSFKQSTGITPHRYVLQRRMKQATHLLEQKSAPLWEIARDLGFADQSQFTRVFHKIVGKTPSQYRKELGGIG
jgi:AraC-like DNA-binding protein